MDPREIELDMLDHLRNIGFNRISMGVQDFNKAVQKAVNRDQDEEFVNALLVRARELGFQSTNLDLIYGLPLQNVESFMFTLHKVIELNPITGTGNKIRNLTENDRNLRQCRL